MMEAIDKKDITVLFAGDSGDGMQLTGTQFTQTSALHGNDVSTFPNFPAEIRAPQGTVAGVSGFQLKFGNHKIFTPGDACDVLVAMNAAALKANLGKLKKGGQLIVNIDGFDKKNLRLAHMDADLDPLRDEVVAPYQLIRLDITKLTRETLADTSLGKKEVDRCKNMFVLGYVYWMYSRDLCSTITFLKEKFEKKLEILEANLKVLEAGYNFGETNEEFTSRFKVDPAPLSSGSYRSVTGNQAAALGLVAAANVSGLELVYGSYPITPASDILHELAKHKRFGVKTIQAEDEIAAVCSAIGASFAGALAVTASSGPGIALKGEAIGLEAMLELPMVIVNVQRGGPSTGLPTKTEQADLLQALYGRNGECPVPVFAAATPVDCFNMAYLSAKIALEHMTPVFFLSDGYIANGSEPWKYPSKKELSPIKFEFAKETNGDTFLPYKRNEDLVRPWAVPGTPGLEHRVGGLEKENETGNVSYVPENHEFMVKTRAAKVAAISKYLPKQEIESGDKDAKTLVLGWGSTFGAIKTAVEKCCLDGDSVAHSHLRYIEPMPANMEEFIAGFDKILVPEINNGQLIKVLKAKFDAEFIPHNKIQGLPFTASEIEAKIKSIL